MNTGGGIYMAYSKMQHKKTNGHKLKNLGAKQEKTNIINKDIKHLELTDESQNASNSAARLASPTYVKVNSPHNQNG